MAWGRCARCAAAKVVQKVLERLPHAVQPLRALARLHHTLMHFRVGGEASPCGLCAYIPPLDSMRDISSLQVCHEAATGSLAVCVNATRFFRAIGIVGQELQQGTCCAKWPVDMRERLDDARSGDLMRRRLRLREMLRLPPAATANACNHDTCLVSAADKNTHTTSLNISTWCMCTDMLAISHLSMPLVKEDHVRSGHNYSPREAQNTSTTGSETSVTLRAAWRDCRQQATCIKNEEARGIGQLSSHTAVRCRQNHKLPLSEATKTSDLGPPNNDLEKCCGQQPNKIVKLVGKGWPRECCAPLPAGR